jgi:hypothetical protein
MGAALEVRARQAAHNFISTLPGVFFLSFSSLQTENPNHIRGFTVSEYSTISPQAETVPPRALGAYTDRISR